jgi:hypothetical protein
MEPSEYEAEVLITRPRRLCSEWLYEVYCSRRSIMLIKSRRTEVKGTCSVHGETWKCEKIEGRTSLRPCLDGAS